MGILVVAATAFTLIALAFAVFIVALLLFPGKKGRYTIRKTATLPGPLEAAWDGIAARLAQHGFTADPFGRPGRLTARKPQWPKPDGITVGSPHAYKPLTFEATLSPTGGAAAVDAAMTLNDFVLLDSGEWAYTEWVADDVLSNRAPKAPATPPPLSPSPSSNAVVGLNSAAVSLAGALLPFVWPWLRGRYTDDYAFGAGVSAFFAFSMAAAGIKEARLQPHVVSAKWVPYVTFLIGATAIAVAAWLFIGYHFPAILPFEMGRRGR